jgi:hypothetical protein
VPRAAENLNASNVMELDGSRPFEGLTSAQYRFVSLVFSGYQNVQAYQAVYDTAGMATSTIYSRANELINSPNVAAKIRELRERADLQSTLSPGVTREFVLNGIKDIALTEPKGSTRLAAYIALGKTVGIDLFRETVVHEKRVRTVEDVETELKDRLAELQRQLTTVEGEARRVDATPAPRDRRRKPANKNPGG